MLTQILINSIISGLLLSLVAIGFNFIFNATRVFHLAHGAMYVSTVYFLYNLHGLLKKQLPESVSLIISIIASLILVTILIIVVEYVVYRPLYKEKTNHTISMISSLGVYLLIVNSITFFFGNESISLGGNNEVIFSNDYFKLTDIEFIHLVGSILIICLVYLFAKTNVYTRIRAITDDYGVAEKFGINIQKSRLIALILGTLLVGVAGIMRGFEIALDPHVGLTITLVASVAVIVGGVNSLFGTIIACFVIALIENFSVKFLSAQWKEIITYTLLLLVLVFYQQGLISVKQRVETK